MGIRERREREKGLRKSQILQAAEEIFNEQGFAGASLELIAERAEISRGTIYFHFNTREELFGTILLSRAEELLNDLELISKSGNSPEKILREMVLKYLEHFLTYPEHFKLFANLQQGMKFEEFSDGLVRQFADEAQKGIDLLSSVIEAGIQEGLFRPVNPLETVKVLWAALNGLLLTLGSVENGVKGGEGRIRKSLECLHDLILKGLRTQKG